MNIKSPFILSLVILVLAFILSAYQGKMIEIKDGRNENYQETFYTKMKQVFENEYKSGILTEEFSSRLLTIKLFYEKTDVQPFWTLNYTVNNNALQYIEALTNAGFYGLDANEYYLGSLKELVKELAIERNIVNQLNLRIKTELLFTLSCLRFTNALENGIITERTSAYDMLNDRNIGLVLKITQGANALNFKSHLLSFQPEHLPYVKLQKALEQFLSTETGKLTFADAYEYYEHGEDVEMKAKQLLKSQYFIAKTNNDEEYKKGLKTFQKLHGLPQTGKLDKKTFKTLLSENIKTYEKVALNLERLRQDKWTGNSYIFVNIPSFELRILENNEQVASFRTVIGKPTSPTPVFSQKIQQIVTNPSWIVPQSISSNELLSKVKRDSTFLTRNNYVVFDSRNNELNPDSINWEHVNSGNFNYRFIQRSSEGNALGKIKFLFPNEYSVYIHDTPSKSLFAKTYRAYSHGCVRLENPHYLAEYLISKQEVTGWDKKLKNNLNQGVQEIFNLRNQLDVHIRYYTCEADENGEIVFLNDIYNLDTKLMTELHKDKYNKENLLAKK